MRLLLKHKLVHHENQQYDGYRLTPLVRRLAPQPALPRSSVHGTRVLLRTAPRCVSAAPHTVSSLAGV